MRSRRSIPPARPRFLAACLGVAAAVCFVVAYINREPGLEGVYFDSQGAGGEGWTSYAPIENSLFDSFDPWDGYLWLGAGIALALAAIAVLVLGRFASPSPPSLLVERSE